MEDLPIYVGSVIFLLFIMSNSFATYVLFKSQLVTKEQRIFQLFFIWLLPVIGAVLVINLNRQKVLSPKGKNQLGNPTTLTDKDAMRISSAFGNHRH